VSDAQLRKQCINGAYLHSGLPTGVAKIGGSDMIFPIRLNQRQRCEAFDDLRPSFWAAEP